MRTFLFDTFNKYKRFSESLDVETTLCNKTWFVFNNSKEREIYIFQAKGKLLISLNGKVTYATWEYIPANKSLIVSGNNQSYMVHAAYVDNILFALNIDGTNEYAFLIDENNKQHFQPQSYNDIIRYFRQKEEQRIINERQNQIQEKKNKYIEDLREKEFKKKINLLSQASNIKYVSNKLCTFIFVICFLITIILPWFTIFTSSVPLIFSILYGLIGGPFIMLGVPVVIIKLIKKDKAKAWKNKHPNDPVNQYL